MSKKSSGSANSPRVQNALHLMLAGKTLRPTDELDRRSAAHIASIIRNELYIPVDTLELVPAPNKVIGYKINESERRAYYDDRDAQISRVKGALERTKNIRTARAVVEFFSEQGKADEVPDWCLRLAKEKLDA